jgi:hypothetical protein
MEVYILIRSACVCLADRLLPVEPLQFAVMAEATLKMGGPVGRKTHKINQKVNQ